jgi:hypothetical protein
MKDVANPPSLHNGHNMMIVDRDLTSYFFSPDGWLYNLAAYADATEPSAWRRGYPAVKLLIDDCEYPSEECRYSAYRALRRNRHCNGISVETDTRMVDEQRGILSKVTFANTTMLPRKFRVNLSMPGSVQSDGVGVANEFQRRGYISVVRPAQKPDSVEIDAYISVAWRWNIELAPGASISLGFVAGDQPAPITGSDGFIQGDIGNEKGGRINKVVADWAQRFDAVFAECKAARENRWADAFTPGNKHFSGHLPVLKTDDAALRRNYYMGVSSLLAVERTQLAVHPRSFITQGERDDGTMFFVDISGLSSLWALLEPDGMKATLRRTLVQNLRTGAWLDLRQTRGFDDKKYTRMYGYAANACLLFKTVNDYLRVTGDTAFLDEKLENGQTVFERMNVMATDWETLPRGPHDLVDFGGNECLLECAPNYTHCVASMNAQGVWLLRQMAQWHDFRKNAALANGMRARADAFLPKVLNLYQDGEGVWNTYHQDGKKVELRHCMDYTFVGDALQNDLTARQKAEMNAFVQNELFTRDWMRAMSLRDEAAPITKRADNGPQGAYDGVIPATVATMWRLGDRESAYDFYRRTSVVTREGPFTQAHEFYGPTWDTKDAPVRISSARGNMRECVAGGTFANVVVETFFGVAPDIAGTQILIDPMIPRPFAGELDNLRLRGRDINLKADKTGVRIIP